MSSYVDHTRGLAEATPASRNRVVDFWRAAAICVVVFGHWLAASIWLTPSGEIELLNSLEWVPYAGWITWLVQVMPIFFIAGGYANARGLGKVERGEQLRRDWITARTRRLFTPVIPLLVVWVMLIVLLRPLVAPEVVYAGAMSATVPIWFLAVYISLTALAPFTHAWWKRAGLVSVAALLGCAVAVDLLRFAVDVPGIGWVNFLFVWAAVHQLGYWWARRDAAGGFPARDGGLIFAAGLAVLVAVTWVGWYPVAMVGVPGAGVTNMTPPTAAMFLLGLVQAGGIWATQHHVARMMQPTRSWHVVVAISGVIMTVYLWHLTAMSFVGALFLNVFDGVVFQVEPGTWVWWLSRPLWLAALSAVTAALVAVFARFEWRTSSAPPPHTRRRVLTGVLLTAGSAAAIANFGIVTPDAVVNWSIPIAALLGAWLLGALPEWHHRNPGAGRRSQQTPPT
ncbi:MAG TPA: acyltransferase [Acidimicrobiia bacterium]|jgi:hypothetical protein|nr:acyltransferase [Acidimicrobiia bacterium]